MGGIDSARVGNSRSTRAIAIEGEVSAATQAGGGTSTRNAVGWTRVARFDPWAINGDFLAWGAAKTVGEDVAGRAGGTLVLWGAELAACCADCAEIGGVAVGGCVVAVIDLDGESCYVLG